MRFAAREVKFLVDLLVAYGPLVRPIMLLCVTWPPELRPREDEEDWFTLWPAKLVRPL